MFTRLNYICRGPNMKQQAEKHLGYIGTRPGKDKEKLERILFGHGGTYTAEQVEAMINGAAKNTYFWRLTLNPDPALENPEKDLDLWDLTREMVMWLERRLGRDGQPRDIPFIAAEHNDHTDKPHIHAILLIERHDREMLITKDILEEFNTAAHQAALDQRAARQQRPELLLEQGDERLQAPAREQAAESTHLEQESGSSPSGGWGTIELGIACPMCGKGVIRNRRNSNVYACSVCGYAVKRGQVLRASREVGWTR
jgi:rubredoxin